MPSQLVYMAMNYGSVALVLAAMLVAVVLTRGTVRMLLAIALAVEALRLAMASPLASFLYSAGDGEVYLFSLVQMVLTVATPLLLVAAVLVGVHTVKAKDATIAALVDTPTETWRQPESSPDPKLFVE